MMSFCYENFITIKMSNTKLLCCDNCEDLKTLRQGVRQQ